MQPYRFLHHPMKPFHRTGRSFRSWVVDPCTLSSAGFERTAVHRGGAPDEERQKKQGPFYKSLFLRCVAVPTHEAVAGDGEARRPREASSCALVHPPRPRARRPRRRLFLQRPSLFLLSATDGFPTPWYTSLAAGYCSVGGRWGCVACNCRFVGHLRSIDIRDGVRRRRTPRATCTP